MGSGEMIEDARLRSIFERWAEFRGDRPMPLRSEASVKDFPAWTHKHLVEVEVLRDGAAPRFRYASSSDGLWQGADLGSTGFLDDECDPLGYRAHLGALFRELLEMRRPIYSETLCTFERVGEPMLTRRLALPLADLAGDVSAIITAHVFGFSAAHKDFAFAEVPGLKQGVWMVLDG